MTQSPNFNFPPSPWAGSAAMPAIATMIQALLEDNSGPSAPPNPVPGMRWRDTSVSPSVLRIRNDGNNGWVQFDPVAAGIGVTSMPTIADMDAHTLTGMFRAAGAATGNPTPGQGFRFLHLPGPGTSGASQIGVSESSGRLFWRNRSGGAWGSWTEVTGGPEPGDILMVGGQTLPARRLWCDGAAYSRTTYADLFARIGTRYGAGNGSTTFNVPDFRGEFPRGWDNGRGIDPGRVLGSWQAQELQSHTHQAAGTASMSGTFAAGQTMLSTGTGYPTAAAGGSETRPRNLAVNFCIVF